MCNKHWMNESLPQASRFCLNLFSNMKLIHCICREFWLLKRSFSHWTKFWIPCNNLLVPVLNPFLQESFSKMRKEAPEQTSLSSISPFLSQMPSSPPTTQTPGYVTIYPELLKPWPEDCKHSIPRTAFLKPKWMVTVTSEPREITGYLPVWECTIPSAWDVKPQSCHTIEPWWTDDTVTTKYSSHRPLCPNALCPSHKGKTEAFWNHRWWQPCDTKTSTLH